jgi:hypothetical protein
MWRTLVLIKFEGINLVSKLKSSFLLVGQDCQIFARFQVTLLHVWGTQWEGIVAS